MTYEELEAQREKEAIETQLKYESEFSYYASRINGYTSKVKSIYNDFIEEKKQAENNLKKEFDSKAYEMSKAADSIGQKLSLEYPKKYDEIRTIQQKADKKINDFAYFINNVINEVK